jgi:hypothetical protein
VAKLVVAKTYFDRSEALVARSVLEAHGFVAVLLDYHLSALMWQYIFALKGIRLCTLDVSLAEALDLLNTEHETGDLEEVDGFELVTTMTLSDALIASLASMCGIPYPVRRRRYRVRP